jgi:hypothetical protein
VKWKASGKLSEKLFQVYVDGRFAGVTIDSQQREILVPLGVSADTAVRIEVYAVEPEDAYRDWGGELEPRMGESGRVRIELLRDQSLPVASAVAIYFDNGTGTIDYNEPLSESPVRIWDRWEDKAGFGMSQFGRSDFGNDGSAAVGFGKGVFGNAPFGFGADNIEWVSPVLPDGVYKFGVVVRSVRGNQSVASETGEVTVTRTAKPAGRLDVTDYDAETGLLVLSVGQ